MTELQRKEWIDRIEELLGKASGADGGMLDKLKDFGSKIIGHEGAGLPEHVKDMAQSALKLLKDPGSSETQLQEALAPLKAMLPELKR